MKKQHIYLNKLVMSMEVGTCLLCFAVHGKIFNIRGTYLQSVYEELTDSKIQNVSHSLCYICLAKLQQSHLIIKQILHPQSNSSNHSNETEGLIHLSTSKLDNTSIDEEGYVYHVAIKQEPIEFEDNSSQRDEEATASSSTGPRRPRGKNAQYYRDYRARKRAEREKELLIRSSDPTTGNSSTINVAGSMTSKKRKSAAEYQREYRAREKAKRDNILIDPLAVIPSTSKGAFTTTRQSIVHQITTAGPSMNTDISFVKPKRRKTPAEYQREYRARKKAQRESTRAAKTKDGCG